MTLHLPAETVTYCHACRMNRLCRRYKGYWICKKRCWKRRKDLVSLWAHGGAVA